jgi:hypothetical protein
MRPCEVLVRHMSGNATNQDLAALVVREALGGVEANQQKRKLLTQHLFPAARHAIGASGTGASQWN